MKEDLQAKPASPLPEESGNGDGHRTTTRAEEAARIARAVRRQSPFYALSFPNFRLFFVGQLISVAGTWMQTVAQQWLVYDITKSPAWLGIVSGASAIPYVLFAVWGGHIADRYPRRSTLIWTQTVMMLLAFVLAALTKGWPVPIQAWHIAVLSGISSIVNAFNMPAQQAFVTDMVDEREALGNAIALNSLRFNLARFIGPILAGAVLVKAGAAMCFFLNGLSFIAVILSLMMMRLPKFVPQEMKISVWEGFRYIGSVPSILRVVILIGAGSLLAWPVSTLYPVFADSFARAASGKLATAAVLSHDSALFLSRIMAANGIGAALGGLALAVFGGAIPRRNLVYGGAVAFCTVLILFSLVRSYWLALALLLCAGFFMIVFAISSNTKVQEEAPDALRGRVMAVYSLVFNGLFPVGGLEIGFLAEHLTANHAVQINASLCLIVTLALLGWSLAETRPNKRPPAFGR